MARPDEHDTSRRDFFRTFGRETVRQAGAVAGVAAELRRSSMAAAQVLFDPAAVTDLPEPQVDESQPDATFRSAYRFTAELKLPNGQVIASTVIDTAIGGPAVAERLPRKK